jgi:NADH dehydrogenase
LKKKIVILGAGEGGLTLALLLEKKINLTEWEIILIDKNNFLKMLQNFHLISTGFRKEDKTLISIIIQNKKINFINSRVNKILANQKKIELEDRTVFYDILIIALGTVTKGNQIIGADNFGYFINSLDDAYKIYQKLQFIINYKKNKSINIIGGGATGLSLAGAIADLLIKNKLSNTIKITIIDSSNTILPNWKNESRKEVIKILTDKNVNFMFNSNVTKIEKSIFTVKGIIESDLTIITNGTQAAELVCLPNFERCQDNRLKVNEYCQILNHDNIFAIGDIACMTNSTGFLFPQISQVAVNQATYLSNNLFNRINKNNKSIERFKMKFINKVLQLGINDYVAEFKNFTLCGKIDQMENDLIKLSEKDKDFEDILKVIKQEQILYLKRKIRQEHYNIMKMTKNR